MVQHYLSRRFHPDASYVWRKPVTLNGVQMVPGAPATAEQAGDVRRLERLFTHRYIEFARHPVPPLDPGEAVAARLSQPQEDPAEGAGAAIDAAPGPAAAAGPVLSPPDAAASPGNLATEGQQAEPGKDTPAAAETFQRPYTARHKGFGQWYVEDAKGATVSGPHEKTEAQARAKGG